MFSKSSSKEKHHSSDRGSSSRHSSSNTASDWSKPEWDPTREKWYKHRINSRGDDEYKFDDDAESSSSVPVSTSEPRYLASATTASGGSSSSIYGTSPNYTYQDPLVSSMGSLSIGTDQGASSSSGPSLFPAATGSSTLSYPSMNTTWASTSATPTLTGFIPQQSQQQQPVNLKITTRDPNRSDEPLDKRYQVHHSSKFNVGKVFKMLWAEPTGKNGTQITESAPISRSKKYQEEFIHKIRYFVVIRKFHGHCLCLPIQTYQRRGTTKPGLDAQTHAVIYMDNLTILPAETLSKPSIRVKPNGSGAKLAPESRINYAKVYTVEFNVKVFFIGKVHDDHINQVLADYQATQGWPTVTTNPGYGQGASLGSIDEDISGIGRGFT